MTSVNTYTTEHYVALMNLLSNEKAYLAAATKKSEIELRSVWIKQIEKEIAQEEELLKAKGVETYSISSDVDSMSEDALLAELLG
jgi:spore coat protein CotF